MLMHDYKAGRSAFVKGNPGSKQDQGTAVAIFESNFTETTPWYTHWGAASAPPGNANTTANLTTADGNGGAPVTGAEPYFRVATDTGEHRGLSARWETAQYFGDKSNCWELWVEFYLRFGTGYTVASPPLGGKMPGIDSVGTGGYGGNPSDGYNGWSARGGYNCLAGGQLEFEYYVYHADMPGTYGQGLDWTGTYNRNTWYKIWQHCKVNSLGSPVPYDGQLHAWVDETLVCSKEDYRFTFVQSYGIRSFIVDIYHGGGWTAEQDMHMYLTDVKIFEDDPGWSTS